MKEVKCYVVKCELSDSLNNLCVAAFTNKYAAYEYVEDEKNLIYAAKQVLGITGTHLEEFHYEVIDYDTGCAVVRVHNDYRIDIEVYITVEECTLYIDEEDE